MTSCPGESWARAGFPATLGQRPKDPPPELPPPRACPHFPRGTGGRCALQAQPPQTRRLACPHPHARGHPCTPGAGPTQRHAGVGAQALLLCRPRGAASTQSHSAHHPHGRGRGAEAQHTAPHRTLPRAGAPLRPPAQAAPTHGQALHTCPELGCRPGSSKAVPAGRWGRAEGRGTRAKGGLGPGRGGVRGAGRGKGGGPSRRSARSRGEAGTGSGRSNRRTGGTTAEGMGRE